MPQSERAQELIVGLLCSAVARAMAHRNKVASNVLVAEAGYRDEYGPERHSWFVLVGLDDGQLLGTSVDVPSEAMGLGPGEVLSLTMRLRKAVKAAAGGAPTPYATREKCEEAERELDILMER